MILSIETATELCGAALVHDGVCVAQRIVAEKNIHSERLLVLVDEVLREARVAVGTLKGIAVSIGPGSFTGLRIGLSAAKGLAYAQSLPLLAVPTLDAIADEAVRSGAVTAGDLLCTLIDAKRDEAYYAFYAVGKGAGEANDAAGVFGAVAAERHDVSGMTGNAVTARCLGAHAIASVSAIAEEAKRYPGSDRLVFAGDAVKKMAPLVRTIPGARIESAVQCSPVSIGMIAEMRYEELKTADYTELEPVYIRDFVATMPRIANQTAIP